MANVSIGIQNNGKYQMSLDQVMTPSNRLKLGRGISYPELGNVGVCVKLFKNPLHFD
jgi:hypothetical protein